MLPVEMVSAFTLFWNLLLLHAEVAQIVSPISNPEVGEGAVLQ